MAGLYIHIPFCKTACNYCNFHFSTNKKNINQVIDAICKEIEIRSEVYSKKLIETIYFGGGTPSLLSFSQLNMIFKTIYENYNVSSCAEVTMELNPDDLSKGKLIQFDNSKINRLSIGIQSFFDEDLKWMNRAHNSEQSHSSIEIAKKYFDNISVDLLYGIPQMSDERWLANLQIVFNLGLNHISCYALTVESKTTLNYLIKKKKQPPLCEDQAANHFKILVKEAKKNGFEHYEVCSFGKTGYFSKHNCNYWLGTPYLGIGPSAHSYNGNTRSWNISNNKKYIDALTNNILPFESESLTIENQFNEYVMTGLRTVWGVSLKKIEIEFGTVFKCRLLQNADKYLKTNFLKIENLHLKATNRGKFLVDGIASDLFIF